MGSSEIRHLEEDRRCPHDLYGESHRDGEVWGSLGWNMLDDETLGFELTSQLVYGAITGWPSDVNWEEAGQSLVDSAEDMLEAGLLTQEQNKAILAHGQASGVIGCGRVISLDEDEEPTLLMVHVGYLSDAQIPLGQQFSLEVPENAYRLRFRIKQFMANHPDLAWTLYVRRGEHIVHELQELGFFEVPIPDVYDEEIEGEGGDYSYELTLDSEPPLEPGETYYFSITSREQGNIQGFEAAEITVDGDVWVEETEDEETSDELMGCTSCSTLGREDDSSAAALLPLAFFFGLALRRRSSGTQPS